MVLLLKLLLLIYYISFWVTANFTKIARRDIFLTRKKRYLTFPPGSNFVIQVASVKALLRIQPQNWNILEEMDFPFSLPSDTRWIRYFRGGKKNRERRRVHEQIADALSQNGMNGTACVKRLMCDVQNYYHLKGQSLLKDILLTIFRIDDGTFDRSEICTESTFEDCSTSVIDYLFEGFLSETNDK